MGDDSVCEMKAKEGDVVRCLGESVSFGRYAGEPLDWAKWSVFSHNRYLEEVEKFSKPGSVAQKKAYFEAHYKKKAAQKDAALAEVVNTCASKVSESVSMQESCRSSCADMNLGNEENLIVQEMTVPIIEVVYSAEVNDNNADVQGTQLELAKVEGVDTVICDSVTVEDAVPDEVKNCIRDEMETSVLERSSQVGISKQVKIDQKVIVNGGIKEEKMSTKVTKEAPSERNLTLPRKKRLVNTSPSRLSTQGRPSKIPSLPAKQLAADPTGKKMNPTSKTKNSEANFVNDRRSTTKSLHMSINSTSLASKPSQRPSPVEKITNLRVPKTARNVPVKHSTSVPTATRASVNGVLTETSVNPWSKDRRAKTTLSKSVTGTLAEVGISKSPSKDQSLAANSNKPRGPLNSCPFSLQSDKRAEKRKEFYQKLAEKRSVEAEIKQSQLRPNKEKAVQDVQKLCQSTTSLKAKDLSLGSQVPSNNFRKALPSPIQSQKLDRQSTTSKILNSKTRSSVISSISKHATQSINQRTSRSVTSLPKKNAHENSSPNIQSWGNLV